jgi:hypothetical protein
MDRGWAHDSDRLAFCNLGLCLKHLAKCQPTAAGSFAPTDLEIYHYDFVAPLLEPLEQMVALMRAPINPIRLLKD